MEGRGQAPRFDGCLPVQGCDPRAGVPQVRVRCVRRTAPADPRRARGRRVWTRTRSKASWTMSTSTPVTASSGCIATPGGSSSPRTPRALPPRRTARQVDRAAHRRGDGLPHGANPSLAGTLPRLYNRDNVDQRRLGELLDLFNNARFTGEGSHPGPRPARRGLRVLPGQVRQGRGQARRRVLHPGRWCGCWSRCWNRPRAGCTTRAAAPAACSCRPRSSWRHTTRRAPTSPSMDRSSTSGPGGWPR